METTTTTNHVVDAYLAAWNETDADRRAALVERAWTAEGRYRDPLLEADGREAIAAMAAGVQASYPGTAFRRTTEIDGHHDLLRFGWELAGPDGPVVAGVDIAELAPDGRLRAVTGFFGDLPTVT